MVQPGDIGSDLQTLIPFDIDSHIPILHSVMACFLFLFRKKMSSIPKRHPDIDEGNLATR